MLKPLAIAVLGALTLSVLLSLAATLTVYVVMRTFGKSSMTQTKNRNGRRCKEFASS